MKRSSNTPMAGNCHHHYHLYDKGCLNDHHPHGHHRHHNHRQSPPSNIIFFREDGNQRRTKVTFNVTYNLCDLKFSFFLDYTLPRCLTICCQSFYRPGSQKRSGLPLELCWRRHRRHGLKVAVVVFRNQIVFPQVVAFGEHL